MPFITRHPLRPWGTGGKEGGGKWVRSYDVVYKKINQKGGSLGKRNI